MSHTVCTPQEDCIVISSTFIWWSLLSWSTRTCTCLTSISHYYGTKGAVAEANKATCMQTINPNPGFIDLGTWTCKYTLTKSCWYRYKTVSSVLLAASVHVVLPSGVGVVDGGIGHGPGYYHPTSEGPVVVLSFPGLQSLGVDCKGTCWPQHLGGRKGGCSISFLQPMWRV